MRIDSDGNQLATPSPAPTSGGTFDRSAIKWGSLYVTQNGRLVTMNVANMTDAQIKAALGMAANRAALADGWQRLSNGQIIKAPAAAAPVASTPTSPTAATPAQPTIDPRDGEYQASVGQLAFDRDRSLAEQEARRGTLASQYNRGYADVQTGFNRNKYDSNAELAQRGIIRSGEYQHRGADREMARVRQVADLEQNYGSGARSEIASRIAAITQQYQLGQQAALASAKQRYAQMYPASPYINSAIGG